MEKRKGTHMSNIANRYEMADYLRKEFPTYQIRMVTWSDYNITEQIQIMSQTRAMISLPGLDVMNGIFLQDGGVLLMYCRLVDPKRNKFDPSNEKKFWYDRVSYVHASTEDCNSTNVEYSFNASMSDTTIINLESLKLRLKNSLVV